MAVPLLDLTRQYEPLRAEVRAAMDRVCDEQRFILGPEVEMFENEAAEALDVPAAVGVSSGTDALLAALMALGVGSGDEVILPTFTFFATAGVVSRVGATPVFADIDPVDYCIPPSEVERLKGPRTAAVIAVHLFGQSAAMDDLLEAAGDVPVIEDAAQAWGTSFRGRSVGGIGRLGAFSFFPSKNLGGFGDGGLVTAGDEELGDHVRRLRMHGQTGVYEHRYVGGNFRLDAMQAAVLRIKLPHVEGWIQGRRSNAARYSELLKAGGLADRVTPPAEVPGRGHTYNQYVVRVPNRDRVRGELLERGIGCSVYYPMPLHLQPCFAELGGREGDLPHGERACREVLALPVFPELTLTEQEEVVAALGEILRR